MYDTTPIAGSPQESEMPGDPHREEEKRGWYSVKRTSSILCEIAKADHPQISITRQ
ncbi:hypothetical protein [Dictyobacter arantiisoli]|uniref:Uncharacterized protein n=1 Tax=Dictyobacter arantiisoli TaxID=2014874 RepID=A0A5A5TKS4_9CHLR|nr:hypothetical protein [Dictyobacter arantiisoli]GCF11669.1 hypothetical protein KDI_52330 [Dictyobacter arantiisoli]